MFAEIQSPMFFRRSDSDKSEEKRGLAEEERSGREKKTFFSHLLLLSGSTKNRKFHEEDNPDQRGVGEPLKPRFLGWRGNAGMAKAGFSNPQFSANILAELPIF